MIEYCETAILLPFLVKCHRRFDMEPTEGAIATPVKASHKKSLQLKGAGDPIDSEASKVPKLSASECHQQQDAEGGLLAAIASMPS